MFLGFLQNVNVYSYFTDILIYKDMLQITWTEWTKFGYVILLKAYKILNDKWGPRFFATIFLP